jgi:hypothetical protein
MTAKSPVQVVKKPSKKRKIPAYLIRETIDGIPFFYAGFKDVVNKKKSWKTLWRMEVCGLSSRRI